MLIYLIRHGQTDWNKIGRIQGVTDVPLNERGLAQARALAEGMKKRPVTAVFTSNLSRACETGRTVAEDQQVPVIRIEDLKEVGFGVWEGLTMTEIAQQYPEELKAWMENPSASGPTGGESTDQVYERVKKVMAQILPQAKGDIAIVSHGTTLEFLLKAMGHADVIVENSSITTVSYDPETGIYDLIGLNDVEHLAGIPRDEMPKII